jgi:hypothetical protein
MRSCAIWGAALYRREFNSFGIFVRGELVSGFGLRLVPDFGKNFRCRFLTGSIQPAVEMRYDCASEAPATDKAGTRYPLPILPRYSWTLLRLVDRQIPAVQLGRPGSDTVG